MPANRWSSTLTGLSTTAGYPLYVVDWMQRAPINLGVQVAITSSSTAASPSVNIEGTLDYTGSSTFVSTAANWTPLITGTSVTSLTQLTIPVTALRVNSTAGSSVMTAAVTILSAG